MTRPAPRFCRCGHTQSAHFAGIGACFRAHALTECHCQKFADEEPRRSEVPS